MNIRELKRRAAADPSNKALYTKLLNAYIRAGYINLLKDKEDKTVREKDLLLDMLVHAKMFVPPPLLKYYWNFQAKKTNPAVQLELIDVQEKFFDGDFVVWYPWRGALIQHPLDITENTYLKIYLNPQNGEGQYPYRTINAQDFFQIHHNEEYVENDNPILMLSHDLTGVNNTYFDTDEIDNNSGIYIKLNASDKMFLKGAHKIIYANKLSRDWLKKQFDQEWPSMAEEFKEEIEANYRGLAINLEPRTLRALKKLFVENAVNNDLIFFNRDDEITAHYDVVASNVTEEEVDILPDIEWDEDEDW